MLQNFVDQVGPVVSAAWLNQVDVFVNSLFQASTTAAAARQAIGAAGAGANADITSLTGIAGPIALSGNQGTAGQVLASQGAGMAPQWVNAGGGSANLPIVTSLGSFSLSGVNANSSTSTALNFTTTPGGWNTAAGCMKFSAQFTLNNYFSVNPSGHFGFILRSSSSSPVNGHGVIFGTITNPVVGYTTNTIALETWYPASSGGAALANYVWTPENLAAGPTLTDGGVYHLNVYSTVTAEGNKFVRALVYKQAASLSGNGDTYWQLLVDTGDVLDKNGWANFTNTELGLFSVFDGAHSGWSIDFTNAVVTWQQAGTEVSDQSRDVSWQNGAVQVPGNLNFVGSSRRVLLAESGLNPLLWTALQNQNSNQGTSVLALPNGSSQTANFFASNNALSGTNYSGVTFGINGSQAVIESFGAGSGASLPLRVGVGAAATSGLFKDWGLDFSSNTITGVPVRVRAGDGYGLETTGTVQIKYNSAAAQVEFWTGSTRKGYVALGSGGIDAQMNAGSGVSSFNTRSGAVTLSFGDVTTALGYTPYNPASASYVDLVNTQTVNGTKTFGNPVGMNQGGAAYDIFYFLSTAFGTGATFGNNSTINWNATGNTYTTAGSLIGYIRAQVGGTNVKIPYYNM